MTAAAPGAPTLQDMRAAAQSLAPYIVRTPLLRFNLDGAGDIYLKPENLQPVGVFKVRCMGNALLRAASHTLRNGVYTASSGNAGIGLAWMAAKLGIGATVYAPGFSPVGKLGTMRALGADVRVLDDSEWWQVIENRGHPEDPGLYVDAVRDPSAMAGNGTIGLEIMQQLPDVDRVIVPFGGGGVACGVASALRASHSSARLVVAESTAAAPVTAALHEGRPVPVPMQASFVSGAGAPFVLEDMWPLVSALVDETIVSSIEDVSRAVRLLFERNRLVAEGAGALSVAAALSDGPSAGKTVCVVTGGNIDIDVMVKILQKQPL